MIILELTINGTNQKHIFTDFTMVEFTDTDIIIYDNSPIPRVYSSHTYSCSIYCKESEV